MTHLRTGWLGSGGLDLDAFHAVVETTTDLAEYPTAEGEESGVLVYGDRLRAAAADRARRREVQTELARALADGPGVVAFRAAFPDRGVVDRATEVFRSVIEEQHASGRAVGDHFAKPGANDRVWGALDKFAVREPELFAAYYANDVIALVSEAWLGRGYQLTSQVNVVNPGGTAQVAHADYHLGFMSLEQALGFPAQVHQVSPLLTLQGAVAHSDMPLETGPTMYLPHSHKHDSTYVAFHRPELTEYFDDHYVQLPLRTGDAVFFNPALLHAAGTNTTSDVRRMANLLQVSSAFGRAMESVDRVAMCTAVFPALRKLRAAGAPERDLANVVAATAEGYAFPTNLDRDQPIGGRAPETQAELLARALAEDWDEDQLGAALAEQAGRRAAVPHPG